ncbi:MAG: AMP-binding protein [Gammaproteobacteria bacterium]|nr:AMP-binding protein [Gammaproteobacteria bacterium]MBQ0838487.1 AMP-binding protein [Gammaproteobacteria bacterium]
MHHTSQSAQFMFRNALWRHASKTAVGIGERAYSYKELDELSSHLAAHLAENGVEKQDRVAILLRNCIEYVVTDLAIIKLGAVKVPLNEMLSMSDVAYMVGHSGAKAMVVHSSLLDKLDESELASSDLGHRVEVDDNDSGHCDWRQLFSGEYSSFEWRDVGPNDTALILYTGGTTGRPKGVMHSHGAMMINGLTHIIHGEIAEGEKLLLISPLPHSAGFFLQTALLQGATAYVQSKFDPEAVLETISKHGITWTFMVPTMIYRVLDAYQPSQHNIASLRTLVYGAAPITKLRLREVLDKFGPVLLQLFGQTEVPNFATKLSKADHLDEKFLGSCGQPIITSDVRIGDDSGQSLPFGEVGEIMARSPYTLECYYNAPDKTDEIYDGEWVKTGDVGYQLDTGHVFIVDRSKDMIISGGMNVYSSEVENVVQEFPGVKQVMVIGIPHEDWGEAVCAAVVPGDDGFDEKALIAFCKDKLAAYKVPKTIDIVDEIPLTAYGKPDKKALRVKYWGEQTRQVN